MTVSSKKKLPDFDTVLPGQVWVTRDPTKEICLFITGEAWYNGKFSCQEYETGKSAKWRDLKEKQINKLYFLPKILPFWVPWSVKSGTDQGYLVEFIVHDDAATALQATGVFNSEDPNDTWDDEPALSEVDDDAIMEELAQNV